MSLNNLGFASDDIDVVRPGDVERWDIVNTTTDPHPIHLHLALVRVLSRQPYNTFLYTLTQPIPELGQRWAPSADPFVTGPEVAPEPWETGWHDTIEAPPGQITRMLVRWPSEDDLGFDPDATFPVPDTVETGAPGTAHEHAVDPANAGTTGATATTHEHPVQLSSEIQPAPNLARGYVWHCHVLDHEDHDMMLPFRVARG
jgi:FtsP/CotA-like multicopper oxidase with cupredoxin domain